MTDEELARLMRQAMLDAVKLDSDEELDDTPAFEPSMKHQRQIQAMLADPAGWARRKSRPVWKTILRRAAVFVIAALLCFGGILAVSPTARAAVVNWVIEQQGKQIIYRYSGETDQEELPVFAITGLPKGYTETDRSLWPEENPVQTDVIYENETGDAVYFTYCFMYQGGTAVFRTDENTVSDITVNDMDGQFFEAQTPEQFSTITWIDPDRNLQFIIDAHMNFDSLLHIAESVSLCKMTK